MSLTANFYSFTKKDNSTARPGAASDVMQIELLADTSATAPELKVRFNGPVALYNYCFIPEFNRYYYIDDWEYTPGFWTAKCHVDVLATMRDVIGASTEYVVRSSHTYDMSITDSIYPTNTIPTISKNVEDNASVRGVWNNIATFAGSPQSFVIGIIGNGFTAGGSFSQAGVNYYMTDMSGLRSFFAQMLSDDGFGSNFGSDSQVSKTIMKSLVNPMQYITGILGLPFPMSDMIGTGSGISTSNIGVGFWNISGTNATVLNTLSYSKSFTISIPKHPQASSRGNYLNNAPYSSYDLYFMPFGTIPIDPEKLKNSSKLHATITVDFVSGAGKLKLSNDQDMPIAEITNQIGIPMNVAQASTNILGAITGALSSAAALGGGGAMLAAGSPSGVGSIVSGASGVVSSIANLFPQVSRSGANGGGLSLYDDHFYLIGTFRNLVGEDLSALGRPLCQAVQISSIPGFVMINGPEFSSNYTSSENEQVRQYMSGGFFYE